MSRNEIRNTWSRWLDRRPIDPQAEDELVTALSSDKSVSGEFLNDLTIHRQIQAMDQLAMEDDSFTNRMLRCFDDTPTSRESIPSEVEQEPDVVTVESATPDASPFQWLDIGEASNAARKTSTDLHSNTSRIDTAPSIRTMPPRKRRHTRLLVGGALCAPIVILGVYIAMIQNFQNGDGQSAKQGPVETVPNDKQSPEPVDATKPAPETQVPMPVGPLVADNDESLPPNPFTPATDGNSPPRNYLHNPPARTTFASVRELKPCRWGAGESPTSSQDSFLGNRPVGRQTLELLTGIAVIRFDDGTQLEIEGPSRVDLLAPRHIRLLSGNLHGNVPSMNESGLVVDSVAGRFTPTPGCGFQMRTNPGSQTEVSVQRGSIEARPWHGKIQSAPVSLSGNGFDTLVVEGAIDNAPGRATFRDRQNRLEGWVNVNGQLLKSDNSRFLDDVFDKARNRFAESPQHLESEWNNLLAVVHEDREKQAGRKSRGPGKSLLPENGFSNADEMMRMIQEMLEQSTGPGDRPNPASGDDSFDGVLNINGKEIRFRSKEEFDEARNELLGTFSESLRHFRK